MLRFVRGVVCFRACVCFGGRMFSLTVWVVFNFGFLWSRYISRLSDLVATSSYGCFREFSSGFGTSNFAFTIVIVELHLGRELIFGREK